jgi:hypothetical protein
MFIIVAIAAVIVTSHASHNLQGTVFSRFVGYRSSEYKLLMSLLYDDFYYHDFSDRLATSYKHDHGALRLETRKSEAQKIRDRYADRVPVIVEKSARSKVCQARKSCFSPHVNCYYCAIDGGH